VTWRLVVRGFLEGKIGAQTAGSFFLSKERIRPSSCWARARVGPSWRRGWHGPDPKNWNGPRQTIQTEVFAFDLAQALAPVLPDAAFPGSAEAFPTLSKDDKDELIDLRIAHASTQIRSTSISRRMRGHLFELGGQVLNFGRFVHLP